VRPLSQSFFDAFQNGIHRNRANLVFSKICTLKTKYRRQRAGQNRLVGKTRLTLTNLTWQMLPGINP